MNKKCYQYDSKKIYIGETIAFNGNLPQNTTFIEPLENKQGFVQIFDGSKFNYVEDHRGENGFVDNEPYLITELGAYPKGWHTQYIDNRTISEKAATMSMSKENFVNMVEEMTTAFSLVDPTSEPITFAKMWEWCSSDPNLLKLFITQTNVYRNDTVFNEATSLFAPQFLQYLDMMFVYQNQIMEEIKLSKEQNRPLDLTKFIP